MHECGYLTLGKVWKLPCQNLLQVMHEEAGTREGVFVTATQDTWQTGTCISSSWKPYQYVPDCIGGGLKWPSGDIDLKPRPALRQAIEGKAIVEMLSPAAKSIYQQYKADTNLVAEWLAITAKAHGHVSLATSCAAKAPAATRGRLRGKAQKQAKAVASKALQSASTNFNVFQDNPGNHRPTPRATYLIRIEEFKPLAAFISRIKSIKVPRCFSTALKRAIFGKKLKEGGCKLQGL
ncbi:hypothetical protein M440DRAFT_16237 [Trichoderma longibrachiatum ATCC 18648]|uniref:DUF6604 domain-containing protein n=1 Tax=Trichoderma longibrachiatum ATCC 18648 TaxID=983965 RepID=A0A2T4CKD0_TRILO|nr:hypothetical protein M440DRAFT_16237 [Trichoderma longibrachiatum ATCC 18648]